MKGGGGFKEKETKKCVHVCEGEGGKMKNVAGKLTPIRSFRNFKNAERSFRKDLDESSLARKITFMAHSLE